MNAMVIKSIGALRDILISELVLVFVVFDYFNFSLWLALAAFVALAALTVYLFIRIVGWVVKIIRNQHIVEVVDKDVSFTAKKKRRPVPYYKNGKLVEMITDFLDV